MKNKSIFLTLLLGVSTLLPALAQSSADFNVVPRPQHIRPFSGKGKFVLNAKTVIVSGHSESARRNARFLRQYLSERIGHELRIVGKTPSANAIILTDDLRHDNPEAYRIVVDADFVQISGATSAGTFYGIQTLRKSLPSRRTNATSSAAHVDIAAVEIDDAPRFAYRGLHLDVSRHFMPADSIRRFIDMLALHNVNRFHWHLTDDQGWRIEIKQYPRLTKVGSQRAETVIGRNTDQFDGVPHGGFYTRRECEDIVKYAAERNITIVPEIDLPGHMLGALAAYPELGCTGGPYKVWGRWGVSDDVLCAGNPKTYEFIARVLNEIVSIFPSEYIHIGGDECPKTRWKTCEKCQAMIEKNGLHAADGHTAEERLQSHVIGHAAAVLASHGRKMIGWDEILEGGLPAGATVMSWRGEEGGLKAARLGHDAIMTPNTYLYFDYYQSKNSNRDPLAFGGYVPLERVYGYEPISASTPKEIATHIIGVQANLWTEYMKTYRQVEYMALPRLAALSEVQWRQPETKDYDAFLHRLLKLFELYREKDYNFAKNAYDVKASYQHDAQRGIVAVLSTIDNAEIRYTLNGEQPTLSSPRYVEPIVIASDTRLRFAPFRQEWDEASGGVTETAGRGYVDGEDFNFSLSTAKPIRLLQGTNKQYAFGGAAALSDGLQASNTNFQSGLWIGFNNEDMEAVIDLGTPTSVSSVSFNTCVDKGCWIYDARRVVIAVSDDGETFTSVVTKEYPALKESDPNGVTPHTYLLPQGTQARYLKVLAEPEKSIPDWHEGAKGKRGFLFVDEIVVK